MTAPIPPRAETAGARRLRRDLVTLVDPVHFRDTTWCRRGTRRACRRTETVLGTGLCTGRAGRGTRRRLTTRRVAERELRECALGRCPKTALIWNPGACATAG